VLLDRIVNRLQGEVRVRVTSGFPERVLNLCGARGLTFWDVCWVSPTEFACSMTRRDYRALRQAAGRLDCTLTAERRTGAPYFLARFRRRYVLVGGAMFCAVALLFGSFFIWDFQIEGNSSVTDEAILRCLERNGVRLGTFGFAINSEDLRNHALLEMPELVWITVNVSGCQAQVQVRERLPSPERVDRRTPQNVVARRAGVVLKITALSGQRRVLAGTTVEQGQLLISGVEDADPFGARLKAGMGTVTARTWYTLTVPVPLTEGRKAYTGEEKQGWSLIFGTHRIKLYGSSSYSLADCDKIISRKQLRLFGIALPLTVERETWRFFAQETAELTPQTAQKRGEALLTAYLHSQVDDYGAISSSLSTVRQVGDTALVTLSAECVEQIGRTVPVYVEETPD
jgi:similar to stage IV sporulation protein